MSSRGTPVAEKIKDLVAETGNVLLQLLKKERERGKDENFILQSIRTTQLTFDLHASTLFLLLHWFKADTLSSSPRTEASCRTNNFTAQRLCLLLLLLHVGSKRSESKTLSQLDTHLMLHTLNTHTPRVWE